MAAIDVIDAYLDALPGESRRLAEGEWGVTVGPQGAGGWPLEVGLRLADGLLTVRAHALSDSEGIDPWMLLWWNRSTRLVRFAGTREREVWVHGDLPAAAVREQELDRLLGLVVEGAVAIREFLRTKREFASAPPGGWLEPEDG
jgi:hypothetical protein